MDYKESILNGKVNKLRAQMAAKANYRQQEAGDGTDSVNMIAGYEGNAIADNLFACTISGGGSLNRENMIGATENVGIEAHTPNTKDNTTGANYSIIGGGYDNVANGLASIIHGFHCLVRKLATHGTISGGSAHEITKGNYNTIGGGTLNKILSGSMAVITGGKSNTIDAGDNENGAVINGGVENTVKKRNAFIGGGYQNTVNGIGGVIVTGMGNTVNADYGSILGGTYNTIAGQCAVVGGSNNQANSDYSCVPGGYDNIAAARFSTTLGRSSKTITEGQIAHASGKFVNQGDAQASRYILRCQTTNNTITGLTVGGSYPQMSNDSSFLVKMKMVARRQDVEGETKAWEITALIQNNTGVNATVIGTPIKTVIASTTNTDLWDVNITTGADSIIPQVTGETEKTINFVALLETVEVIA
jgi:hypothetical protein